MDELSQLDELIESDILEALGQETAISNENNNKEISIKEISENINIKDFNEDLSLEEETEEIKIENLEDTIDNTYNEVNENIPEIENKDEKIQMVESTFKSNDLASLLSQLLNNKTIEITIKIKD